MRTSIVSVLWSIVFWASALQMWGRDVTVTGFVRDISNNKVIDRASLIVNGTDIGTVSNAEGYFSLTFPDSLLSNGIRAELIGYKSWTLRGSDLVAGEVTLRYGG